ncbi:MAG: BolA family protein, partial [Pseudomonadota bacterium]
VVSMEFENKMLVARHRILNQLLKEELEGEVHALSLNTLTPSEWLEKKGEVRKSPPCLGGKAKQEKS